MSKVIVFVLIFGAGTLSGFLYPKVFPAAQEHSFFTPLPGASLDTSEEGILFGDLFAEQCVAGFYHYTVRGVEKENEEILGPVYMSGQDPRSVEGWPKLLGIDYMFTDEMLFRRSVIDDKGAERLFVTSGPLPIKGYVDHIEIQKIIGGHAGLEENHYDINVWSVEPETRFGLSKYKWYPQENENSRESAGH